MPARLGTALCGSGECRRAGLRRAAAAPSDVPSRVSLADEPGCSGDVNLLRSTDAERVEGDVECLVDGSGLECSYGLAESMSHSIGVAPIQVDGGLGAESMDASHCGKCLR